MGRHPPPSLGVVMTAERKVWRQVALMMSKKSEGKHRPRARSKASLRSLARAKAASWAKVNGKGNWQDRAKGQRETRLFRWLRGCLSGAQCEGATPE